MVWDDPPQGVEASDYRQLAVDLYLCALNSGGVLGHDF